MKLTTFNHEQFGEIRVVEQGGEPWFIGKDVAEVLGYSNSRKAITDHVDTEDKDGVTIRDVIGRQQTANVINESGLYSLILSSKLPNAKKFKRWVTSEVIPSIRKTGGYLAGQESMSDDELIAKALLVAKRQIEEKDRLLEDKEREIKSMMPAQIFADAVCASEQSILIGGFAKMLRQNGVDMGQKRLFAWLREHGYLMRCGSDYNLPTQKAMNLGLFEIKETAITHSDGRVTVSRTVKLTGKGQQYFFNKFLGRREQEVERSDYEQ